MKNIQTLILVFASVLFLAPASRARELDTNTPPGKEFVYKQSGGEPQKLEVYFPKDFDPAKSKVPGVILFHGGGWTGGDLSAFRYQCQYFASRGLVAATANYRMIPKKERAQLPAGQSYKRACITDAKSAIRWMKQHAGELGVDPQRLIAGGGSAGGHIVLLATTNPGLDDPADPKGFDTRVVAYSLFNPALSKADATDSEVDALNNLSTNLPPAIVFFGTEDKWKSGWMAAEERLKSLGVANRTHLWLAGGQSHGFFNNQPWENLTLIEADRFLVSLGLLKGGTTLKPDAGSSKLIRTE